MKDFHIFCNLVEKELAKELPGKKYQNLMASPNRLQSKEKSIRPKKGSVLILTYPFEDKISLVLIKRALSNYVHSGQISFPGGKYEKSDKSLVDTAIRETNEEIGVVPEDIKILGSLTSLYIPVSNFMVYPAVGYLNSKPIFIPNPSEVQEVIEISLEKFVGLKYVSTLKMKIKNREINAPCYDINDFKIWGATAMIISEFAEILRRINMF